MRSTWAAPVPAGASEAMDAPMLEVAAIRKMRQRLGDKQMEIDHQSNLLRRTNRNLDLPFEVKRHRTDQAETKLTGLKADFRALEAEGEQKFFGGTPQFTEVPKVEAAREPFGGPVQVATAKTNNAGSDKWAAKGWGGPRGPYSVPTVNLQADRREYIIADRPARFDVEDNPKANNRDPWYLSLHRPFARNAVIRHTKTIERLSKAGGVDPELVKAIMYLEHAGGPQELFKDELQISGSILPMNINAEKWSGLGIDRKTAYENPVENIRAGIKLIRRIQDRLDDPTAEKVATLYNGLMKERVSDYGAQVGRYYREKPWLDYEPPSTYGFDPSAP